MRCYIDGATDGERGVGLPLREEKAPVAGERRAGETPEVGGPRMPRDVALTKIFLLFSRLGLSSFGGGVSAWIHRAFVEQRSWLSEREFAAMLALSRIMPGTNVVNLAVMIGQRLRGAAGAAAAAAGLIVGPSLVVVVLAVAYRRLAGANVLHAALEGAAAAAAGLIIAMVVQAARYVTLPGGTRSGRPAAGAGALVVLAATFVAVAVLRWPTVTTVAGLAPLSIALAFLSGGRGAGRWTR